MGGKRRRTGQYFYVCLAGLLTAGSFACMHDPGGAASRREHLLPVRMQIESRDFAAAAEQYEILLSSPDESGNRDLALFDLGLLHSHYANPRKDYQKSLLYFNRMIQEHPESPLVEQAKILVNLIETMQRTQRVDIELEEKRRQ